MKKIIFSIFAIAVSVSLFAQDPSATQITLNSEDGNSNSLTLMEKTTFAPIYDATSTAFTGTLANTHNVNVYATYNTNKISIYKAKTLINVPMVVVTNADVATKQHYTLSFTVSKGRIMKLYDVVLDSMIYMNNGTSYAFEVTTANCPSYVANTHTTISDRFIIEPQFVPSTDPLQVCSDYDAIRIVTNPFTTNIVIKDADGKEIINQEPRMTPQKIDMSSFDAGHYFLEIGTYTGENAIEFSNKPVSK